MTVTHATGDLLRADVEALVNTVNTVGVMGKGIALQFKQAFPENFKAYKRACDADEIKLGSMFVFDRGTLTPPRYIINFPTKKHWRSRSQLADIEAGLADLRARIEDLGIKSVAVPPLGCGNGGLDWADVGPMIRDALAGLPGVDIRIYPPAGAPAPEAMRVGTKPPAMNSNRATLLAAFQQYLRPGYRLSKLEAQKLAYMLQAAGQPLKLNFERGRYGPYAEALNHVLVRLEGHFIRGYGDRSQASSMYLTDGTPAKIESTLSSDAAARDRLALVASLIDGLETPYGLELLATVHWLAAQDSESRDDRERAVTQVQSWSDRKKELFRPNHIAAAWQRLSDFDWVGAA